jgi:hypothetical protein
MGRLGSCISSGGLVEIGGLLEQLMGWSRFGVNYGGLGCFWGCLGKSTEVWVVRGSVNAFKEVWSLDLCLDESSFVCLQG